MRMDVNGQEHEGTPFAEKGRLRRLGPSPLALCLRALCLLDAHHASGCTVQAALQTVFGPSRQGRDAAPDGVMDSGKLRAACHVDPAGPNARDRALAAELTYGALRHERRLGFVLGKCVSKPQGLPLPLRRLLQAGTYALLFLERVPPHAVVHTAVNLASSLYGSRLGGLVNAALRAVQRLGDGPRQRAFYEGPEPLDFFAEKELSPRAGPEAEDPFALAARYYGLPSALAACLVEEARGLPERVEALFRRSSERPWNGWRINASRPGAARLRRELLDSAASGAMHGEQFPAGLNGAVMAVSDWGLALPPGCLAHSADGRTLGELDADGLLSAQAAGSQQVLAALNLADWLREDRAIWDACAGQGGKGLALAEQGGRLVLCTDTSRARLARMAGQCARLRLRQPLLALADARHPVVRPVSWQGGIIADVPCSGLGVLARRPDIRRRPLAEMRRLVGIQAAILRGLAGCLAPGGELAYMTCTLRREENEAQVEGLLRDMPGLICLSQWKTPWDHPWLEGMFGARLRRVS